MNHGCLEDSEVEQETDGAFRSDERENLAWTSGTAALLIGRGVSTALVPPQSFVFSALCPLCPADKLQFHTLPCLGRLFP